MEFFQRQTNINFMNLKNVTGIISLFFIAISLILIFVRGLNWGIDFTGGYQIQVEYEKPPVISEVKEKLRSEGFSGADVMTFGSPDQIMVRLFPERQKSSSDNINQVGAQGETHQQQVRQRLKATLASDAKIISVNFIGPKVGKELATSGILAFIVAMICMVAYIAFRFEIKFGISAGLALLHDPIIILGIFALFKINFDLTALAALLAVIGYSLNDTVVIYDRIRENFRKMRKASVIDVMNRSVNDTLARTIITSLLTLIVCVVLFLFGGASIYAFSLTLILGVIIGTYSSIYIASTVAVILGMNRESLLPPPPSSSEPQV